MIHRLPTIQLSNGMLAIVDAEDLERLNQFKWHYSKTGIQRNYVIGYRKHNVSMASEIMQKHGVVFDHIDRNPLNNSKINLRITNRSQNAVNTGKRAGGLSKYKGVSRFHNKWWRASITKNGVKTFLGKFKFEKAAALAYDYAALELFGEFANTNFIGKTV